MSKTKEHYHDIIEELTRKYVEEGKKQDWTEDMKTEEPIEKTEDYAINELT